MHNVPVFKALRIAQHHVFDVTIYTLYNANKRHINLFRFSSSHSKFAVLYFFVSYVFFHIQFFFLRSFFHCWCLLYSLCVDVVLICLELLYLGLLCLLLIKFQHVTLCHTVAARVRKRFGRESSSPRSILKLL